MKIQVEYRGEKYVAKATDTDVMKASAFAYINAVNSIMVNTLLPIE
ncbi:alpha-isopropylmalate synthase regulatory domain-containing protein [Priestia megaterium]